MRMFHWGLVSCLKNYGHGNIIVIAGSLEQAREKARSNVKTYLLERYSWWFGHDGNLNDDDKEDHAKWMATFEADILKDPYQPEAIFLSGSE